MSRAMLLHIRAADEHLHGGSVFNRYSVHLLAQVVSVAGQTNEGRVIGDAGFKASLWPFAGAGEDDFLPLVRIK
eukprot:COSAG02_NODE_1099_length_14585_cov_19.264669_11_plen_74_part_00